MREWFGDVEAIWLVVVPILLAVVFVLGEKTKRRVVEQLVGARLFKDMVVRLSRPRRAWKLALRVAAALLIAVGIMRPQWGSEEVEIARRGIDIVFAVDTSKSMLAEDVAPNRMERVKQDIRWFVDEMVAGDRIALVAFAGSARILCPLTLDRSAFDIFLDELDVGIIPVGGTSLKAALSESLAAFGDDERNHKAIVLFTDGEAHDGVPDRELEEARKRGVRIYTVGIGDEKGARIPIVDENGRRTFLKDEEGNIVLTRLDDRIVKTIAQRSLDGAYTHLTAGRQNLARIYRENIARIEERELASKKRVRKTQRFQWFLGAAFALLALQALIVDGGSVGEPLTRGGGVA